MFLTFFHAKRFIFLKLTYLYLKKSYSRFLSFLELFTKQFSLECSIFLSLTKGGCDTKFEHQSNFLVNNSYNKQVMILSSMLLAHPKSLFEMSHKNCLSITSRAMIISIAMFLISTLLSKSYKVIVISLGQISNFY